MRSRCKGAPHSQPPRRGTSSCQQPALPKAPRTNARPHIPDDPASQVHPRVGDNDVSDVPLSRDWKRSQLSGCVRRQPLDCRRMRSPQCERHRLRQRPTTRRQQIEEPHPQEKKRPSRASGVLTAAQRRSLAKVSLPQDPKRCCSAGGGQVVAAHRDGVKGGARVAGV